PRRFAQRPLPSMTIATCLGIAARSRVGGYWPVQSTGLKSAASLWVFLAGLTSWLARRVAVSAGLAQGGTACTRPRHHLLAHGFALRTRRRRPSRPGAVPP